MPDSMKKYMFASLTSLVFVRSISRDFTSAEWRYMLCGIMTAPIIPIAWINCGTPQFLQCGTMIEGDFVAKTEKKNHDIDPWLKFHR